MRVNGRKEPSVPLVSGVNPVRHGPLAAAAVAPAADDQVSVSETARQLAILRIGVGNVSLVREEKVTGLRAVMAKGQYSADFQNVARDVLRELLSQLLG
jgi:anti-sigma28 factor (negative regulator of flagellin synthesis)